jgi:hypothetical protein
VSAGGNQISTRGAPRRLVVVASGPTRGPARCTAPTGSEAGAPARSEVHAEAGTTRCEARSPERAEAALLASLAPQEGERLRKALQAIVPDTVSNAD